MRFMIIRKADAETEAESAPADGGHEALLAQMMAYNEEMAKAGVLVGGDGLMPSSRGYRIKFSNGTPSVIDGPFTEAKELVAGFTMIKVSSREEALDWVKRWPKLDGHGNVELELRQVYEAEDFGPMSPEQKEQYDSVFALSEENAR